ncbi:STAS domain-containing protein [Jidongwangia harbinensis]|uniref:STAS domain-containing protein n=1 Tax=Jidongwangia harbinensis TaxID=2878561 RepID=UPI001CDA4A50|nr:STAS domain-containing protein [Jidongwangia harbinensis]MCA2219034.1 STAS domain-containing protein [Jidongwangia harbinensis]
MGPKEVVVLVVEHLDVRTMRRWGAVLADALEVRPERLVVDLAGCPRVDAAAIAALLSAHRAMVRAGGNLLLRSPGPAVLRMLMLARVDNVLQVETVPAEAADTMLPLAGR